MVDRLVTKCSGLFMNSHFSQPGPWTTPNPATLSTSIPFLEALGQPHNPATDRGKTCHERHPSDPAPALYLL